MVYFKDIHFLIRILVLVKSFSYVTNDFLSPDYGPVPDRCHPIPNIMYRQCCVFPPFFKREIAKECGAIFKVNFINRNAKVAGLLRRSITGCKHWTCMLNKYMLLSPDGNLDDEKYFMHLDKWVDLNPQFSKVILNAKVECKLRYRMLMPLDTCQFYQFQSCIRNFVTVNCPAVLQTPECKEQKAFYDECKEYFQ
ncbi:uncharacterized protein LOC135076146 [Ostrinia nubilalis]|uniref:uncharacterized protein LOC135076146 n=1 Tax=Ostrinia nubilalis TaxID=29057 RepID=UPI00308244F3